MIFIFYFYCLWEVSRSYFHPFFIFLFFRFLIFQFVTYNYQFFHFDCLIHNFFALLHFPINISLFISFFSVLLHLILIFYILSLTERCANSTRILNNALSQLVYANRSVHSLEYICSGKSPWKSKSFFHFALILFVLYCIVLYCIVLYCIVLYCVLSYRIVLNCVQLYSMVQYYMTCYFFIFFKYFIPSSLLLHPFLI